MEEEVQATPEPAATPEHVATPAPETEAAPEEETQAEAKTFTQDQLNEIIQKEKAKAESRAERRALKAYRETLERLIPQKQPEQAHIDDRPTQAQYADFDDYVEAVAEWKLAKREQFSQQQKREERAQSIAKKSETFYAEAAKSPGFDRDAFDDLPLTPAIANAVIESDAPAKLMVFMASNPEEVQRIAMMRPDRQLVEIGKIEAKLATAQVKISKAPAPITPIGANQGGSKDPSQMTDAEFAAMRKKQIMQRR